MDDDVFGRTFRQVQRYKRRADRSAMEVLSIFFLLSAFVFWAVVFWGLLSPPHPVSLQTLAAAVMAFVFASATPLLLSTLIPTTPAGQMLQKSQFATVGYIAIIGATGFLGYTAFNLLDLWVAAQLANPADPIAPELVRPIALSLAIAFILIPALGWSQVPFERMMLQIRQNHEIKRLELLHKADLAVLKGSMMRAKVLAFRGWANLLPAEQEEIVGMVRGLAMSISDSQRKLIDLTGLSTDYDKQIGILGDEEIDRTMRDVQQQLSAPADLIDGSIGRERDRSAIPAEPPPNPRSAPQRPAAPRSAPQYGEDYALAEAGLRGAWSVHALADVLGVKERTARDRLNAWKRTNLVRDASTAGRFYFTEQGEG